MALASCHSRGHVGTDGSPAIVLTRFPLSMIKRGLLGRYGNIDYKVPQSDGMSAFANHLIEGATLHQILRAISGEAVTPLNLGPGPCLTWGRVTGRSGVLDLRLPVGHQQGQVGLHLGIIR